MLLVLEHSASDTLGTMHEVLTSLAHRLRICRLHRGERLPEDLDDIDGIIALGGPGSANDPSPTTQRELELFRTADAMGLPLLGICLGSQLLAKAFGGTVSPLRDGPEIGWREVRLTPVGREEPLFAGIAWGSMQFHWHHDEVASPPPGARVLASSDRCAVQAWGLGLRVYGIQYHPELDEQRIHRMIREGAHELSGSGGGERVDSNALLGATREHLPAMQRLARRLFEQWALFVAPIERRYRGIVKDLVH
ncbi:MAG TPA: type 1 glutamine amidotransferase [Phycisphaerales bacterium]|nr:type 1 glutamine amidotransferase [Phycisphaerales bacterium]HMP37731.1 type 1 glutamine amidotransferase [Phycisphaerales bacterium]